MKSNNNNNIKNHHIKKLFGSSNAISNPFKAKLTRYIALTYHKINLNLKLTYQIDNIIHDINKSINKNLNYKIQTYITDIILQKEPYDLNKNPENEGLCHLHALITLNRPINLRYNTKKITECFIIEINKKFYYPHIAPVSKKTEYEEYITKTHKLHGDQYTREDFYCIWNNMEVEDFEYEIEKCFKNADVLRIKHLTNLIKQTPKHIINKNWLDISRLQSIARDNDRVLKTEVALSHLAIDLKKLKYTEKDFIDNPNYETIKKAIQLQLDSPTKQSPIFVAVGNTGKTTMVVAALQQIMGKVDGPVTAFSISNYKGFKDIDAKNASQYKYIFYLMDDFNWEEFKEDKNILKQLFTGPEQDSNIATVYGSIHFKSNHSVKIFCMNHDSLKLLLNIATNEIKIRLNIIYLDENIKY